VALADYVNLDASVLPHLTAHNAETKWNSYYVKFKSVKRNFDIVEGTKYGLSEKDFAKGVTTVEAKLERECYAYKRMDALFGSRPNVKAKQVAPPPLPDGVDYDDDDIEMIRVFNDNPIDDDFPVPRSLIKHTNGILKNCWTSLKKIPIQMKKDEDTVKVNEWIIACIVLHNIAILFRDDCEEE
jgi:hypothetical protein